MFHYIISEGVIPNRYSIDEYGNIYDYAIGRYITQKVDKTGYMCVQLMTLNNSYKTYFVHNLVMESFCVCKKVGDDVIKHIDGNKFNNHIRNLKYISSAANKAESTRKYSALLNTDGETVINVQDGKYKNDNTKGRSLMTDEQVNTACYLMSRGMDYKQILWTMSLPDTPNLRQLLSRIKSRKAYTEISSKYNIPDVEYRAKAIKLDDASIHRICDLIARGATDAQITFAFGISSYDRSYKRFMKIVENIRYKKTHVTISDRYF